MTIVFILRRRLDAPGHDACRLDGSDHGWMLDGAAVFQEGGVPARLTYSVTCDLGSRPEQGQVHGWVGRQSVEFMIARTSGGTGRSCARRPTVVRDSAVTPFATTLLDISETRYASSTAIALYTVGTSK